MKEHLFSALKQQLKFEVFFVTNVSNSYYDAGNNQEIVDFKYKSRPCQLVMSDSIKLIMGHKDICIESYTDLLNGLIYSGKKTTTAA